MLERWKDSFLFALISLLAVAVLIFSGVMGKEVVPYFGFQHAFGFLGTKTDAVLAKPLFQWAFYVHISSSLVVIVAGLVQFFPKILKKRPSVHRFLGKIYVAGILIFAAPSGLALGFYANGGLSSKVGFVMQSIVWWALTLAAWAEIRKKKPLQHSQMMLRSYAVTLAAMSLRTESYVMYHYLGTKPIETYLTVTWLSWVGNLLLAELLIYAGAGHWLYRKLALYKRTTP
jgi:Predicted membrane protein (DUF2306).